MVIDKVPIAVVHPIRSSIRPRHVNEGDVSVTTTLHVAQVNIIVKMLFVELKLNGKELGSADIRFTVASMVIFNSNVFAF